MSAEGVRLATLRIADDLLALATLVMEDDSVGVNSKVGRNTLKDSALKGDLFVTVGQTFADDAVIKALFNNYVVYLEWDRPAKYGKKPPISALIDWAKKNGIPTDAGTLWAISTAIWRDGHEGRPIFATVDNLADDLFASDWADDLFNNIIDNLDKFFND